MAEDPRLSNNLQIVIWYGGAPYSRAMTFYRLKRGGGKQWTL